MIYWQNSFKETLHGLGVVWIVENYARNTSWIVDSFATNSEINNQYKKISKKVAKKDSV